MARLSLAIFLILTITAIAEETPEVDARKFLDQNVIVISAGAEFRVPDANPVLAPIGQVYHVSRINESWLWVTRTGGWIDTSHVILQSEGESHFNRELKEQPSAESFFNRAMMWSGNRRFDRAIVDFEATLRLDPNFARAHNGLGSCFMVKGQFDRAIEAYTDAIETDSKLAAAYSNRGNAWQAIGEFSNAINDYQLALELEPGVGLIYNNRGNCYLAQGDVETALENYSSAIKVDPYYADAFNNRGYAWQLKGEFEKAIQDFRRSAQYAPTLHQAYNNAAWIRATCPDPELRDGDLAVSVAMKACELTDYRNWYCLATLAAAHAETGEFDRAVRTQLQAISLLPEGLTESEQEDQTTRLQTYLSGEPVRIDTTSRTNQAVLARLVTF